MNTAAIEDFTSTSGPVGTIGSDQENEKVLGAPKSVTLTEVRMNGSGFMKPENCTRNSSVCQT